MNFDKFKKVLPKNAQIDSKDTEYLQHLNGLKEPKQSNIWAMVGTVAAAVAIVSVVALWALIGRGIRGTQVPHEQLLYPAGEVSVELTDDMQQKFDMMYHNSRLFALPIFKEGESISQKAFSDYVYYIETDAKSDWIITASELNDLYFDTFGQKSEFTSGINYDEPYTVNVSLVGQKLLSFTRSFLPEETQKITLTYGEPDVSVTTLTYIAKVGSDFEPEYFIEHTTLNTVILKKSKDDNTAADLYKISEKLADELLDFVRDATDTKDRSVCYCVPTHTIVFNDVEYKVVLGSKLTSHIVYTDARDATTNHKLTEAEFNKLKGLLDQCITDKNFIKTQKISYTPSADKVTVTVDSFTGNYKQGTHTITGDDAKALITALETKSYTGLGGLQGMTAELKINERTYSLYIDDDFINIENSCGGLQLSRDDDIAKIVEKYIKNPEDSSVGTIIETGHSTYDESEFITKEQAVSIAVEEAKKDKYEYQGWDSDFYFNDSSNHNIVRISTAQGDWQVGYWVKEWQTEHFTEYEQICWRIRLFDKNDPLTSLIMYIDAETGNVIGASELSD